MALWVLYGRCSAVVCGVWSKLSHSCNKLSNGWNEGIDDVLSSFPISLTTWLYLLWVAWKQHFLDLYMSCVEWHQQELILFSGIFPANKTGQDRQTHPKVQKNSTDHLSPRDQWDHCSCFFFSRSPSPKFQRCPAWVKQSRCNVKKCIHSQHSWQVGVWFGCFLK